VWVGIDAGKTHHHCCVVDADGRRLFSRRVANDEQPLLNLIAEVTSLGEPVAWAIDIADGGGSLVIALLVNHGQKLFYVPGRVVHSASAMYRGDGKTDARDAAVIADQARMRGDLQPLRQLAEHVVNLQMLTGHRADLSHDRVRTINRLRNQLLSYFPALERAFDYAGAIGPLKLLLGFRTPQALREIGRSALVSWLTIHKVRNPTKVAVTALAAAESQHTQLVGEDCAAEIVKRLARRIFALNDELEELDRLIEQQFRRHHQADVLISMPGFGPRLAAEFVAATGGDVTVFGTTDRLAAFAGLAPAPRDSGRIRGNLRRPQRFNRRLLRACYLAAQVSIQSCPQSRRYYDAKRAAGKRHTQAVLCLARRRSNVLWAMLRDQQPFQPEPNTTATPDAVKLLAA
jgi:transposase